MMSSFSGMNRDERVSRLALLVVTWT